MNYNEYKDIENWSKELLISYSLSKIFEDSQLGTNVTWNDAYCQIEKKILKIWSNSIKMQHIHSNEEENVIDLKPKFSLPLNIWNDDIDHDLVTHIF